MLGLGVALSATIATTLAVIAASPGGLPTETPAAITQFTNWLVSVPWLFVAVVLAASSRVERVVRPDAGPAWATLAFAAAACAAMQVVGRDLVSTWTLVTRAGLIVVARPDFPANDVKALIASAKANPGKISFASPGFGATQHFTGELFRQTAGIDILHVPFRSSPEAISAVVGKQVDVLFDTISAVLGQVQSGQLKALAVTGKDRFPAVPDVPAAIESGVLPGYDVTTWYGVFAPRDIPRAIVARLNKTINESLTEAAVQERLTKAGVVVGGSTPEKFGKHMADEVARWNKVREAAGIPQQ